MDDLNAGNTKETPRSRDERRHDTELRLANDIDCWVATASPDGTPYLVPLSFDWDGTAILLATSAETPTARNLAANPTTRLALGLVRDVVLIDGDVEILAIDTLPSALGDRFAVRTGFDPRTYGSRYCWYRVIPRRIQAWREANELTGRDLMRNGHWLE